MRDYAKHIRKTLRTIIHEIAEHIEDFCYRPGHNFTRKRKLPPETLLSILVGMGGDPLRNELLEYWNYSPDCATVSALVQQRKKLKPLALETLFQRFVRATVTPKLYCGYRLLAADGSDLQFPTNPKDPDSYVPASEKKSHAHIQEKSWNYLIRLRATRVLSRRSGCQIPWILIYPSK